MIVNRGMRHRALTVAHPMRGHRDASVSFYFRDPNLNVIQILYEPSISPQKIAS